jgi:putative ABC transport system substrate-binding protein
MKRRTFVGALCAAVAWPLVARAQAERPIPVVGYLSGNSSATVPLLNFFREGLGTEGFVEGQTVAFEFRMTDGQYDKLPALAQELVGRKVSVIVADGAVSAPLAAKQATTKIPIVFITGSDPVHWGLVASLNRPGGNITGVSISAGEMLPKKIELLRQLAPNATVIGLIVNPNNPNAELDTKSLNSLAEAGGWILKVVKVTREQDLEAAFDDFARARVGGLTIGNDALLSSLYPQIATLATHYKVAALVSGRQFVSAGGLAAYGPRFSDLYRLLGEYTGRVLKGTKPADLPVYYPTKFDLVINLNTAKAIGLTIPPSLLARADEVIE